MLVVLTKQANLLPLTTLPNKVKKRFSSEGIKNSLKHINKQSLQRTVSTSKHSPFIFLLILPLNNKYVPSTTSVRTGLRRG